MASFHYQLGTLTKEQYDALEVSLRDADDSTYIARAVELTDGITHSPTRGVFWLSEEEAAELEKDPQISFIHKDPDRNPDDYPQPPADELKCDIVDTYRYNEPIKNHNTFTSTLSYPSLSALTNSDLRRCGYQLLRTTRDNGPKAKRDIWASGNVTSANIKKYGTGKDVDCIVMDNGTWIGHIEFINNRPSGESPTDYVGGNVLPGNGICDVLSLVHDSPYYIDPDWFNAAPGSRLETRWDGTTVPTEQAARDWWGSTSSRSSAFASFTTLTYPTNYTRMNAHGNYYTVPYDGDHGTPCGSQVFGRTHGWAYNCNKWIIDGFSGRGLGLTRVWDFQKLFHQMKPVNPKYGTKDPTLSSNSWGYRSQPVSAGYTFHRTAYPGVQYNTLGGRQMFVREIGQQDGDRLASEFRDTSITISAKEMIDAGVIFVGAAGNANQKQVRWDHPDYDNYWHQQGSTGHFGDGVPATMFGFDVIPTVNRPGFPGHAGATFGDPQTWTINVQNNGSSAYTMSGTDRNGSVSGDNPTITINRGDTVNFVIAATGHPFKIQTNTNAQYPDRTDKLMPLATNNTAAGLQNGTITWMPNQRTPSTLTGHNFKYICSNHSSMTGIINVQTGNRTNPAISVGALDDQYYTGTTKECKVSYSNMGNSIDLFAPADGTLAAWVDHQNYNPDIDIPRHDRFYVSGNDSQTYTPGDPAPNNPNSQTWSDGTSGPVRNSRDVRFSGTSAACPIACGLIATVMEFNRNWTEADIKTWLATLQNQDTTNDFFDDTEDTDPNSSGFNDYEKLQGATARVIYQGGTYGHTTKETTPKEIKLASSISITGSLGLTRK